MSTQTSQLTAGEIRHTTTNPTVIIKVSGPIETDALNDQGESIQMLDSYMPTNEFPKYHYIVVLKVIDSYAAPGNKFCLAHLITHSSEFDNYKITENLYDKGTTSIDLTKSYVTRDKFLIPIAEVKFEKIYGHFDLEKLKKAIEY